jgi:PAS domain-containing protein
VSASSNIQELLGYDLEELLSKRYRDLLSSAPDQLLEANIGRLWSLPRKERYFFKSKVSLKRGDGRYISGIMQSKFIATPSGAVLFSVFRVGPDSGASRLAPEFFALREYPFFLQIDLDGICLDASGARTRPYSREKSEVVGKPFTSFMRGDAAANQRELLHHLQTGKTFEILKKEYTRANGSTVFMDACFMPNFDSDGACTDYTVYVFNETILAHHEEQFALDDAA